MAGGVAEAGLVRNSNRVSDGTKSWEGAQAVAQRKVLEHHIRVPDAGSSPLRSIWRPLHELLVNF